jgi:hypothetical protein
MSALTIRQRPTITIRGRAHVGPAVSLGSRARL